MTANYQPATEKAADTHGDVHPTTNEDVKLEDRIADEKDDEMARVRMFSSSD